MPELFQMTPNHQPNRKQAKAALNRPRLAKGPEPELATALRVFQRHPKTLFLLLRSSKYENISSSCKRFVALASQGRPGPVAGRLLAGGTRGDSGGWGWGAGFQGGFELRALGLRDQGL